MRLLFVSLLFLFNLLHAQNDHLKLHYESIVVDTHADVLLQVLRGADISKRLNYGHVDLVRLKEGGVDVQFFAVWPNPDKYGNGQMYNQCLRMIDALDKIIKNNPQKITLTKSPLEIEKAIESQKIAACIGVEGGTGIENDLDKLTEFYNRGVRYLGLTWNDSPDWATSAKDEVSSKFEGEKGLTDFGKKIIRKMNELGMIIDVSHSGETTFYDVLKITKQPIIASHSCVYSIANHYRNLKDAQIKALAKNGGVIFINFYPGYLNKAFDVKYKALKKKNKAYIDSLKLVYKGQYLQFRKHRTDYFQDMTNSFRPTVSLIVDHIDYIINLVGDDYVGIGPDFDGISITPKGINDVSDMPKITKEMISRGYSDLRIKKILGGNFMRVFRAVSH